MGSTQRELEGVVEGFKLTEVPKLEERQEVDGGNGEGEVDEGAKEGDVGREGDYGTFGE